MTVKERYHLWFSSNISFGSDLVFLFKCVLPLVVSMCRGFCFRWNKVAIFANKKKFILMKISCNLIIHGVIFRTRNIRIELN